MPKIWFTTKLSKSKALDLAMFFIVRQFKDGLTFFEFHIDWDMYKCEHNPSFDMALVICNFVIFELDIYTTPIKKGKKK